jgi:arginine exporter protein ArgO
MVRKLTFVFAVFAALVVAMGWVPQFIVMQGHERMMFGLFMLSPLDDITHGLTAVAAVAACLHSRRASLLFLTAFGWYYALDAVFFLTYGVVNDKPWLADVLLNAPHVIVSSIMLGTVYWLAPREELAGAPVPVPA